MPLAKLSGGEQARVLIARLMLKPADLLLLDEPTNDLDIGSLKVLETSLLEFPGALVLVTHDRFLLDRVSRQILALDGRGNATFHADLDQWESAEAERTAAKAPPPTKKPAARTAPVARPALTYLETKELKSIEGRIQTAEIARARAAEALTDPVIAADADELIARQARLDEAEAAVEALYRRWEELEAKR
jgi:ATP-binding cassette subfamily F protein uup